MRGKQIGSGVLAVLLVLSAFAPMAAAAVSDVQQNPEISADVTKDVHQMSWGTDEAAALTYEGDNGDQKPLPATVNSSEDVDDLGSGAVNPYSFTPTDVDFADASAFPHNKGSVSAVDNESEWSKIGANSAKATISDVETAPGVEAVEIGTSSMTAGDVAGAEFSNFSVTSDVQKRYLQLGLTVDTLDSGAVVEVRAVDADGDYVEAEINTSRSSGEDYITNSTGDGIIYQRQVGEMSTVQNGGDGTLGEIQKVQVRVTEADANVDIMALNVEKMSKWTLGEKYTNTDTSDDDDDLETATITEHKTAGDISVHSLSTLGSTFSDAEIHDLTAPMNFRASDLEADSDVSIEFPSADGYPSFDFRADVYYRLELPSAYDLSYANAELTDSVKMPSNRYTDVEYAEGVSDTDFEDIDDASWSSVKSSYDNEGDDVTLDSTIQPGTQIAYHSSYLLTSEEKQSFENALSSSGAAMGPMGGGSGGILGWLFSLPGMIVSGITGLLVGRSRGWF